MATFIDYERQIRLLKDEVSYLSTDKTVLQERYTCHQCVCTQTPLHRTDSNDNVSLLCFRLVRSRSPSPMRSESPTRAQLTNSSRYARLISRFNDLHAVERLEAQVILRRHIDDVEMVQKVIFIAVVVGLKLF